VKALPVSRIQVTVNRMHISWTWGPFPSLREPCSDVPGRLVQPSGGILNFKPLDGAYGRVKSVVKEEEGIDGP